MSVSKCRSYIYIGCLDHRHCRQGTRFNKLSTNILIILELTHYYKFNSCVVLLWLNALHPCQAAGLNSGELQPHQSAGSMHYSQLHVQCYLRHIYAYKSNYIYHLTYILYIPSKARLSLSPVHWRECAEQSAGQADSYSLHWRLRPEAVEMACRHSALLGHFRRLPPASEIRLGRNAHFCGHL